MLGSLMRHEQRPADARSWLEQAVDQLERLLETVSFEASDMRGQSVTIDETYVNDHLAELSKDEDLSQYIL